MYLSKIWIYYNRENENIKTELRKSKNANNGYHMTTEKLKKDHSEQIDNHSKMIHKKNREIKELKTKESQLLLSLKSKDDIIYKKALEIKDLETKKSQFSSILRSKDGRIYHKCSLCLLNMNLNKPTSNSTAPKNIKSDSTNLQRQPTSTAHSKSTPIKKPPDKIYMLLKKDLNEIICARPINSTDPLSTIDAINQANTISMLRDNYEYKHQCNKDIINKCTVIANCIRELCTEIPFLAKRYDWNNEWLETDYKNKCICIVTTIKSADAVVTDLRKRIENEWVHI